MSSPPVNPSTLGHLAYLSRVLPRSAELTRLVAAQSQMEALLYAVRRAIAADAADELPKLAAEANRISGDFAAACGNTPDRAGLAVIALGATIQDLCTLKVPASRLDRGNSVCRSRMPAPESDE